MIGLLGSWAFRKTSISVNVELLTLTDIYFALQPICKKLDTSFVSVELISKR
jgi:hypothetical protein